MIRLLLALLLIVFVVAACNDTQTTTYPGNGAAGTESVMPAVHGDDWRPFRDCRQVGNQVWCIGN